jgi:hypothetical protein
LGTIVQNQTIRKGRTFSYSVDCIDEDGNPRDLTGYSGAMQIRETPESETILGTATVTVDEDDGVVTAVIPAATTAAYEWTAGVYDLTITSGLIVETVAEGRIGLQQTVTR